MDVNRNELTVYEYSGIGEPITTHVYRLEMYREEHGIYSYRFTHTSDGVKRGQTVAISDQSVMAMRDPMLLVNRTVDRILPYMVEPMKDNTDFVEAIRVFYTTRLTESLCRDLPKAFAHMNTSAF